MDISKYILFSTIGAMMHDGQSHSRSRNSGHGCDEEIHRPRMCLNKCGNEQTPGKAFCSAECCKEYREKKKRG